jgi:hypothetical protein
MKRYIVSRMKTAIMPLQPDYEVLRERMVREQLMARHITDPRVLTLARVPRHRFVPSICANRRIPSTARFPSATTRPSRSRTSWR